MGPVSPYRPIAPSKFQRTDSKETASLVGVPPPPIGRYRSRPLSHLISRLVNRSQHLLALRLSAFLGLSPSPVIRHWAQQLIAASAPAVAAATATARRGDGLATGPQSDEDVCRVIVDKLRSLRTTSSSSSSTTTTTATAGPNADLSGPQTTTAQDLPLSSADIALTAFRLGRRRLARLLIDREPRASKQVPLLLRMEEGEEALRKALQSGDPDLGASLSSPPHPGGLSSC